MLTQAELKSVLHYDPETGLFRRLTRNIHPKNYDEDTYIPIKVSGVPYLAHRLAVLYMTGRPLTNEFYVDHINGKRNDNRWANLRVVNYADNARNCKRRIDNGSGVTGVNWEQRLQKWKVQIGHEGAQRYLGVYSDFDDAVELRQFAEEELGYHPNHGRIAA